ncbi:hypothetical protein [Escherichia coli]|uniref:hypothetical protein n=1 Tax=Escherichia coli TaxID=562 RepID=UPI000BDED09B|nr:hypothetical protein [Escherichia coli]
MLPAETLIWQPEFTDKTLSRQPGAVQFNMFHSTSHQAVIMAASVCATDLFRFTLSLIHFYLTGSPLSF